MSPKRSLRRQLFVDGKIQGALVARVILYWAVCLIVISLMLLCWRIHVAPAQTFRQHFDAMWLFGGPALIASLILLPLVVVDVIRLSNRFVGPLLRLRQSLRAMARGEKVKLIEFRQDDFWKEFADEFNAIVVHLQQHTPPEAQHDPQQEAEELVTPEAV